MFKILLGHFRRSKLSEEAFWAYYNRLPDKIQVAWFRSDNYIVGKVNVDGKEYFTQGNNANDFINMVNDLVITICEIPNDYVAIIKESRTYEPLLEERNKLEDNRINHSVIGFRKTQKKHLQYA